MIFKWAGLAAAHSGDLYGASFPHHHLFFTYSPMAALVFAGLSVVPMTALNWLIAGGSVASLTGALWLTWGMRGDRRSADRLGATLATAGIALWLGPVQQAIGFGQVNLMLMLIVVAGLCLPDTSWAKGAGVGLASRWRRLRLPSRAR